MGETIGSSGIKENARDKRAPRPRELSKNDPICARAWGLTVAIIFISCQPVTLLTPGRAGILLMTEVIFGIGSAWLLANEILGLRELIGAGLIMSATVLEVTAKDPNAPQPT